MERVATEPLPELDAFLPLWLARIEQEPSSENEWEGDRDRWLREAVHADEHGRRRCPWRGAIAGLCAGARGDRIKGKGICLPLTLG